MLPIKGLLNQAVHRAGISSEVRSAHVVQAVSDFLDAAMLPSLRGSVHVTSFAHGVLKISCEHSVASNETKALEGGVMEAVTTADPKAQIRHLLITVQSPNNSYF